MQVRTTTYERQILNAVEITFTILVENLIFEGQKFAKLPKSVFSVKSVFKTQKKFVLTIFDSKFFINIVQMSLKLPATLILDYNDLLSNRNRNQKTTLNVD